MPEHIEKYHQLKKELLAMLSLGSLSSNWSAPKAWTQGLYPPCPKATKYREKKKKTTWNWLGEQEDVEVLMLGQLEALKEEIVNKPRPCEKIQIAAYVLTTKVINMVTTFGENKNWNFIHPEKEETSDKMKGHIESGISSVQSDPISSSMLEKLVKSWATMLAILGTKPISQ